MRRFQDFARWYDFDTPTREATRGLVPGPIQAYAFNRCYSEEQMRETDKGLVDCPPFPDGALVAEALDALRADPAFVKAVRRAQAARFIAIAGGEVDAKVARELAERLRGALP